MPKNAPIKANTIDEVRLAPHLRRRGVTSATTIYQEPTALREKYLTLVAIVIGDLLVLGADGYLHHADNTGGAAEYIALTSGGANELIEVNSKGILNKEMAFPDASLLFLGTAGGYTNVPSTTSGTISQLIGTYNAVHKTLTYHIGNWYRAE